MHYFIDGYNMLFRGKRAFKELQNERESLLEELNRKAFLLNLNLSVVFDAAYQAGGRSRSHFNALEIIYTAEGETADEYLVDMCHHATNRRQIIVVTNDKILTAHIRHFAIKTETVQFFMQWLNKGYAKRLKNPPVEKKILSTVITSPIVTIAKPEKIPEKKTPETELEYYQRVFETEYEELLRLEKVKPKPIKKNKKPKSKLDPFILPRLIESRPTEIERWLVAFEKELDKS